MAGQRQDTSVKVLIFTTFTKWVPAFETDLELLQLHLDRGDEVLHLYCDGSMPACDANYDHRLYECLKCVNKRRRGMSPLSRQNLTSRPFYNLTAIDRQELLSLQTEFGSIEELKNYGIGNLDLGYAALSSLISATRNPESRPH